VAAERPGKPEINDGIEQNPAYGISFFKQGSKMGWPHEHWDNGVCYFHVENWNKFEKELASQYPHNEHHRRIRITLAWPREKLEDVPANTQYNILGGASGGHDILWEDRSFSVIFEPYPRWFDPYNPQESWRLFAEDGHPEPTLGEKIVLYSTNSLRSGNVFAFFRDRYWRVFEVEGGHYGPHPAPKQRSKTRKFWNIDDLT
jgi:hypothetical protein